MDTRINIAVIIGVVFVLAFAITLTQYESQVESQDAEISEKSITPSIEKYDPSENTISVNGSATLSSEPDTLIIILGVESEAKTANESLSQNSNSLNSVISSIINSGISEDDIQTSNFSIYPLYDSIEDPNGNWQQILKGYRVSNILSIQTEQIDSAGNIIDVAVSSGANRVDNVSFQLSDDKLQKISDNLIADAINDATQKAQKALVPLKQQIVGVKSVIVHDNVMPYYYSPMRASFDGMESSMKSAPIMSGDEEIRTNVSVIFYIAPE
ncbi:MAG: SIMPL domain-containing protein [Crenarchaeota archaeon]|nr:SIMPL domain-containing protein [Thermoproteota archaeon]MDA1124452.1 SIMPL domain-containing protein [Thermoproteota archaeon]